MATKIVAVSGLVDAATGALVGFLGADGKEYTLPSVYGPTSGLVDSSASPGNVTQNALRGQVAIAAGQSTVTVTNNLVTTKSHVQAVLQANDSTLTTILSVVPSNGSFVIKGNANATAATKVSYRVDA